MTAASPLGQNLERRVAEQYRRERYSIVVNPSRDQLPFDLDDYQPDLIATRGGERLIIAVKSSARRAPMDRLIEIAERVRAHPPWRFFLITEEDVPGGPVSVPYTLVPIWRELAHSLSQAAQLELVGEHGATILWTWALVEGILRRRALDTGLPIHRMPTSALIKQLYSLGEISAADYETLLRSLETRNRLAHGFGVSAPHSEDQVLRDLASRLLLEWEASSSSK